MSITYYDFPLTDGSRICVQHLNDVISMPYITKDGRIPFHAHDFYEIVLIMKNSCRHIYHDDETTLLPGDLFLIQPHQPHAYQFEEEIDYYNCQFYIDTIAAEWLEDIHALSYDRMSDSGRNDRSSKTLGINRRGILHMSPENAAVTAGYFNKIILEQEHPRADSERMKRSILHLVLTGINRIREQSAAVSKDAEKWKQEMISDVLGRFQEQINTNWDMDELAAEYHISASYFRSIFRKMTGIPPLQYMNKMRINRAVDMIQHQGLTLSDASFAVGIYDMNYFSRLCKQFTGYPPSYFRRK